MSSRLPHTGPQKWIIFDHDESLEPRNRSVGLKAGKERAGENIHGQLRNSSTEGVDSRGMIYLDDHLENALFVLFVPKRHRG